MSDWNSSAVFRPSRPDSNGLGRGNLFEPTGEGTKLDHFLVQSREIVTGSREGGFFIMIGRKPARTAGRAAESSSNGERAAADAVGSYAESHA